MKLQTSVLSLFAIAALGTLSSPAAAHQTVSAPVTVIAAPERPASHLPEADRDFARPALRGLMAVTPTTAFPANVPSVVPAGLPPQLTKRPTVVVVAVVPTSAVRKRVTPVRRITVIPAFTPAVGAVQSYALSVLGSAQYSCLVAIVHRENPGWITTRYNQGGSGAYGIPQSLPGSKMATAGPDWRTNGVTQVKWMIGYVNGRYGSACSAWAYWKVHYSY